jgi:hypothetical protein
MHGRDVALAPDLDDLETVVGGDVRKSLDDGPRS